MEKLYIHNYEFFKASNDKVEFIFSTASGELNFNKNLKQGMENINKLKDWFNLREIGFLNQIHSDYIHNYDGEIYDGDALITNKKNIALGVFSADCVPILLHDKVNGVIAAVHSGWKGTLLDICGKTVEGMRQEYGTCAKDIIAYIGPHNKACCYEIGEEVAEKFREKDIYKKINVTNNGKLNLEKCIINSLVEKGVPEASINTLNICTYCNKEEKLYSYRKDGESNGRLFSFVVLH
jgi:YfiH family protein